MRKQLEQVREFNKAFDIEDADSPKEFYQKIIFGK